MTFGEDWGWGAPADECRRMLEAYGAAGGNFVDTANHYTNGSSERILGELLAGDRDRWVLATKYTLNGRPADPNAGGNHRKSLVQALEGSLRRLRTDRVDLVWVHAWDFVTPVEEILRALDDAVRAGKVLYVGVSDAPAWAVARANTMAELRGWSAFVGLQVPYGLAERTPERELLPMAAALDVGVTAWGVLGGGVLTGKYRAGAPRPAGTRFEQGSWGDAWITERNLAVAAEVGRVAGEVGATPSQVAIAWVRGRRPGVLIPIVGARRLAQLEEALGALAVELPPEARARLDAASAVPLGFPQEFLGSPNVRKVIFGDTEDRLDDHRRPR
jgi:aryl-alcohol dehydrogenase-like predicted oxidoreductase